MRAGLDVCFAGSGSPVRIARVVEAFVPGARVAWADDAVRDADLVILAIPLSAVWELDPDVFAGKVVIDCSNYWQDADGLRPDFDDPTHPTSQQVQEYLVGAHVVKAFNHVGYHDLAERAHAKGVGKIGIAIAGDDDSALAMSEHLVRALGYEPVRIGMLAQSGVLEPRSVLFGAVVDAETLCHRIAETRA